MNSLEFGRGSGGSRARVAGEAGAAGTRLVPKALAMIVNAVSILHYDKWYWNSSTLLEVVSANLCFINRLGEREYCNISIVTTLSRLRIILDIRSESAMLVIP